MTGDIAVELGALAASEESSPSAPELPVIRVERGNPTPAQLAALTVVLAAASGGEQAPPQQRRTLWTARSRFARPRPAVGPGGWRASALPR
ncbi:hypothetical protein GCM10009584_25090 [Ornithinimicrobium humiphilum]|uniref:Acyl-CoA carboxylase epsilon subunit-like protein n=1 Tax=Ornithinimicrobium humiphilum TaxID=125288 RepID=A0A543KMC4_9MICO|nr:acyl-CoA carboxylase epsilon subunit [Ornithinimicrobium humiphilum]TQM96201.1 acyl-CoA carboxylase epsilon subunit-like protein [Ornithinimicrobium humiphilum]